MLVHASPPSVNTLQDLIGPRLAAQLDRLDLLSRKVFAGKLQGERRSKRRGRSVEFDDYREYTPGDDLRHIDWNVLARLDRFFIKVFQEEEDLAVHLVIDRSASMLAGSPSKLLLAARIAVALGYIGLGNNNRVLVTTIGAGGEGVNAGGASPRAARLEPLRGRRNIPRLTRFVIDQVLAPPPMGAGSGPAPGPSSRDASASSASPSEDFTRALRAVAADPGGRGVMVLLSDLLIPPAPTPGGAAPEPGYAPGLRLLAGAAHQMSGVGGRGGAGGTGGAGATSGGLDVYVLQILSPGELDPSREGASGDLASAGAEGEASSAAPAPRRGDSPVVGDLRLQDVETGRYADVTISPALIAKYKARVRAYVDEAAAFCKARGLAHALAVSDAPIDRLIAGTLRRLGALR